MSFHKNVTSHIYKLSIINYDQNDEWVK